MVRSETRGASSVEYLTLVALAGACAAFLLAPVSDGFGSAPDALATGAREHGGSGGTALRPGLESSEQRDPRSREARADLAARPKRAAEDARRGRGAGADERRVAARERNEGLAGTSSDERDREGASSDGDSYDGADARASTDGASHDDADARAPSGGASHDDAGDDAPSDGDSHDDDTGAPSDGAASIGGSTVAIVSERAGPVGVRRSSVDASRAGREARLLRSHFEAVAQLAGDPERVTSGDLALVERKPDDAPNRFRPEIVAAARYFVDNPAARAQLARAATDDDAIDRDDLAALDRVFPRNALDAFERAPLVLDPTRDAGADAVVRWYAPMLGLATDERWSEAELQAALDNRDLPSDLRTALLTKLFGGDVARPFGPAFSMPSDALRVPIDDFSDAVDAVLARVARGAVLDEFLDDRLAVVVGASSADETKASWAVHYVRDAAGRVERVHAWARIDAERTLAVVGQRGLDGRIRFDRVVVMDRGAAPYAIHGARPVERAVDGPLDMSDGFEARMSQQLHGAVHSAKLTGEMVWEAISFADMRGQREDATEEFADGLVQGPVEIVRSIHRDATTLFGDDERRYDRGFSLGGAVEVAGMLTGVGLAIRALRPRKPPRAGPPLETIELPVGPPRERLALHAGPDGEGPRRDDRDDAERWAAAHVLAQAIATAERIATARGWDETIGYAKLHLSQDLANIDYGDKRRGWLDVVFRVDEEGRPYLSDDAESVGGTERREYVTDDDIADLIIESGLAGRPIRLVACRTTKCRPGASSLAETIARRTGSPVLGVDALVWNERLPMASAALWSVAEPPPGTGFVTDPFVDGLPVDLVTDAASARYSWFWRYHGSERDSDVAAGSDADPRLAGLQDGDGDDSVPRDEDDEGPASPDDLLPSSIAWHTDFDSDAGIDRLIEDLFEVRDHPDDHPAVGAVHDLIESELPRMDRDVREIALGRAIDTYTPRGIATVLRRIQRGALTFSEQQIAHLVVSRMHDPVAMTAYDITYRVPNARVAETLARFGGGDLMELPGGGYGVLFDREFDWRPATRYDEAFLGLVNAARGFRLLQDGSWEMHVAARDAGEALADVRGSRFVRYVDEDTGERMYAIRTSHASRAQVGTNAGFEPPRSTDHPSMHPPLPAEPARDRTAYSGFEPR